MNEKHVSFCSICLFPFFLFLAGNFKTHTQTHRHTPHVHWWLWVWNTITSFLTAVSSQSQLWDFSGMSQLDYAKAPLDSFLFCFIPPRVLKLKHLTCLGSFLSNFTQAGCAVSLICRCSLWVQVASSVFFSL